MGEHERNEACVIEFENLKERITKMEELQMKRDDDFKVVEKAIVAIQVANEQTAKTLEKMDAKMEQMATQKPTFWTEETKKMVFRYGLIVIALVIIGLLGTNIIEGIQAIQGVQ